MSLVMMALLLLLLLSVGITGSAVTEVSKVCRGTSEALSTSGDTKFRYNRYKNAYTNCTYIEGNLEITFLDNSTNYDLSFLENIQEVTGYVLIVAVYTDYLPLTKLRIIRGRELFMYNDSGYSLYIAINNKIFSKKVGLKELRFVSLSEIITGKVMFMNNDLLCFENTIFWSDISTKEQPPVTFSISANHEKQKCGECDASCYQETTGKRHCWGLGPSMCQKLSHGKVCSESCDNRCFGKLPNQCCHPECASGCTGPKKTNCLACRNFFNDGECVPFCPNIKIYDNKKYKWIENPDARYTYGSLCVKDCPEHMLKDEGACVKTCPSNKLPINNTCLFCKGPCPKRCKGNQNSDYVTAMTLSTFKDCTVIEGSLKILTPTFDGDKYNNISGVTQEEMNVFSTVKEITGFLMVQSLSNQSENLSFLRSLEVIGGRDTHNTGTSMNIYVKYMTSLELTSLKKIKNGNVIIKNNKNLCFADTINFKKLFSSDRQQAIVEKNGNKEDCEKANEVCDKECSSDGCWGKGPTKCLSCKHYHVENTTLCIASCSSKPRLYDAGRNICSQCHSECANNCTGPNLDECDSCLNVKDGPNCRNKCPPSKYPDKSKICQMCHETCANGCSGPHNEVRWGGCKSCEIGIEQKQGRILCLSKNIESCPSGYYRSFAEEKSPMSGKQLCKQCHSDCKTCNGPGTPFCDECRHFKLSGRCYKDCPGLHYGDPVTKLCKHCHTECINGCTGPTASDCFACKYFKVYTNDNNTQFNCTDKCPEHKQYLVKDDQTKDSGKTLCADKTHPEVVADLQETEREERKKLIIIISSVSGSFVVVLALMVIACHYWRQRARAQENTAKLTARMTGFEETEPLTPTNVKPDLAQLRLIKESELRRGGIIGSGAFGTVYKGFWIPKGENVKIPVAIKVLQEGTSPSQNKELLEEARVMASVDQQCCIRILAVCMTAQMMLITQLMPLGCLLDYVRKNKDNIGSKALLNWCMQIARGMTYLEERAIVHRDLAARNVLLQSPGQVKITDFGLAKLLDYNEDEYHAAGGKMPIKWLALECIQHRIFTHKSDVWSYGVTVWELFTYGQRPYENIRARDVPDLLEKGERLPQPSICTIDVYMIMIKCWMLDADSRPGFKELAEEFAKMARDPGRYLVIRGDKLMRLPSLSYDKDALLRSLSVATDGPEELMEADDYLQPQSAREQPSDNNNGASKRHGSTTADFASLIPTTDRQEKEADPPNRRREKRYGHLESAAAAKQQRQLEPSRGREDSVNSRYSSDPIKILPNVKEKDEVPESRLFLPESPPEADLKKKMKKPFYSPALQLPLDEDDYLQPKSANPAAYMDLIDGKDNIPNDMQQMDNGKFPLKNMPMVSVENPEYFGDEDQENWESNKPSIMEEALSQPESNNFDYYNDVTKLEKMKREMQPLIIDDPNSETMV